MLSSHVVFSHFTDKFSFLLPELEEEEEEEPGAWGLTEEPTIRQFPFRHHLTIIVASEHENLWPHSAHNIR